MAKEADMTTGGCLCGAIRYDASGVALGSGYCHCRSCRHHTGAPVAAFVVFTADQVQWMSGKRARFESSPGKFRAFCSTCGTSLTWEGHYNGTDLIEFHISTLDDPDAFPPNEHTHYRERISWLHLSDDLTRYEAGMY
ncbi:MAG: GFA family protein [Pseudomonadota bacterium]